MRRQVGSTANKVSSSALSSPVQHEAPKRTRGVSINIVVIVVGLAAGVAVLLSMLTKYHRGDDRGTGLTNEDAMLAPRQDKLEAVPPAPTDHAAADADAANVASPLPPSNATIVTAYFSLASKFPKENYDKWMSNMLSLQDSMVIYTSPNLVEHMQNHRKHAPTVVIGMELSDLPLARDYSAEFWQQQLDQDPEKRIHKSYQLFWIWLSKSWFVTDAIQRNHFSSQVYVWSDIGCFRNQNYNSKTMMQHYEVLPSSSILQMAHHDTKVPPYIWWNNKYAQKPNFYHSGSQMAANKDVWQVWHQEYTTTMKGFIERSMFIGEDQTVAQSTCLRVPDLCRYVPTSQVRGDNHYFGLRYVLHHGGNYTYWRPPDGVPAEPKEMEERKMYQV
jgi:hypothetical protein